MMAALTAAEDKENSVLLLERQQRVGRKLLATGNGRCNFSNSKLEIDEYRNAEFVSSTFDALGNPSFVLDTFEELGLLWREEPDGRLYPLANKASVVVDVLRAAVAELGVHEACEREVAAVEPPREEGKPFTLRMSDGVFERADAVLLTCGGRWASSIGVGGIGGLSFEPLSPVLGPLRVVKRDIPLVRELDNIRIRCSIDLARDRGAGLKTVASERGAALYLGDDPGRIVRIDVAHRLDAHGRPAADGDAADVHLPCTPTRHRRPRPPFRQSPLRTAPPRRRAPRCGGGS